MQLIVNVNARNSINVSKGKSKLELNLNLLYSFISLFALLKIISFSTNFHIPLEVILCSINLHILSKTFYDYFFIIYINN